MKKIFSLLLLMVLFSCHKREVGPGCDTPAMVIDLSATGGCGFGFKLADGSVLIADQHTNTCGHKHNPLLNFQLVDSMKVKIGYETEHQHPSPCASGKAVEITCIEAVTSSEKL